jgi:hypothetical protein
MGAFRHAVLPDAHLWPYGPHHRLLLITDTPSNHEPPPKTPKLPFFAYIAAIIRLRSRHSSLSPGTKPTLRLLVGPALAAATAAFVAMCLGTYGVLTVVTLSLLALVLYAAHLRNPDVRPFAVARTIVVHNGSALATLVDMVDWPKTMDPGHARHRLLCALWWTSGDPPTELSEFYAPTDSRYAYKPSHTDPVLSPSIDPSCVEVALSIWDPQTPGLLSTLPGSLATSILIPTT